jgi:hypothetical protein
MTQVVAPSAHTVAITMEYSPTAAGSTPAGLSWCIMHDNPVLAWRIDESGASAPEPVIIGNFPNKIDTAPYLSPQWAVREGEGWAFMIPNMARGTAGDLFTFIATNHGAKRPIYANFSDSGLVQDFAAWGRAHPTLWLLTKPQ